MLGIWLSDYVSYSIFGKYSQNDWLEFAPKKSFVLPIIALGRDGAGSHFSKRRRDG